MFNKKTRINCMSYLFKLILEELIVHNISIIKKLITKYTISNFNENSHLIIIQNISIILMPKIKNFM
jgi:hypothetical protein